MSRSVLLQLARDSIEEVLQAQITIDRTSLLNEHPLLNETLDVTLNLFINQELKGSHSTQNSETSLLSNIILSAKKAAFEDKKNSVFTTSDYLNCEVEIVLDTPDGEISQKDPSIIHTQTVTS